MGHEPKGGHCLARRSQVQPCGRHNQGVGLRDRWWRHRGIRPRGLGPRIRRPGRQDRSPIKQGHRSTWPTVGEWQRGQRAGRCLDHGPRRDLAVALPSALGRESQFVTPRQLARWAVMRVRTNGVIPLLMGLVIVTACGSATSVATSSPTPTPAAIVDDHFGFIVGNAVRLESDAKALFVLPIPSDTSGVVSPDGRRLAYVGNNDVRVIDIAPNAQPRTLFTLSGEEGGAYLAWSSDSTGLVFGVTGPPSPVNEGPPAYTKLRIVDAAGATARALIRIPNATALLPAAPPSSARNATLAFRVDGKAVVISRQSGVEGSTDTYAVAVDLASGRSVAIPVAGNGPIAGTSVRIGP